MPWSFVIRQPGLFSVRKLGNAGLLNEMGIPNGTGFRAMHRANPIKPVWLDPVGFMVVRGTSAGRGATGATTSFKTDVAF